MKRVKNSPPPVTVECPACKAPCTIEEADHISDSATAGTTHCATNHGSYSSPFEKTYRATYRSTVD